MTTAEDGGKVVSLKHQPPLPTGNTPGTEGSRKLRFPDFMKTAHDGGKIVSLTHRSSLPPGNTPGTHFC
jgi:hypothetical protein